MMEDMGHAGATPHRLAVSDAALPRSDLERCRIATECSRAMPDCNGVPMIACLIRYIEEMGARAMHRLKHSGILRGWGSWREWYADCPL